MSFFRSFALFAALLLVVRCWSNSAQGIDDHEAQAYLNRRMAALRQLETGRALSSPWDQELKKRSPHQIEQRSALNSFKNCYFSPIQCVLMERRRK
ncbi:unnamed protein product, partial [Mesorhabditis belari]|uniref:Uncharacterized protein n=1 Tax=Mesorhabditis belari TaxID=2138241 RepID=A0AAF3FCH8_9BILA